MKDQTCKYKEKCKWTCLQSEYRFKFFPTRDCNIEGEFGVKASNRCEALRLVRDWFPHHGFKLIEPE